LQLRYDAKNLSAQANSNVHSKSDKTQNPLTNTSSEGS
jgi:hypothetical protein